MSATAISLGDTRPDRQRSASRDSGGEIFAADQEIEAELMAKMNEVYATRQSFFARQFEPFHHALESGGPFPVMLQDARRSLELITALFEASETGQVVTLPIGPDHPRYRGWHASTWQGDFGTLPATAGSPSQFVRSP